MTTLNIFFKIESFFFYINLVIFNNKKRAIVFKYKYNN